MSVLNAPVPSVSIVKSPRGVESESGEVSRGTHRTDNGRCAGRGIEFEEVSPGTGPGGIEITVEGVEGEIPFLNKTQTVGSDDGGRTSGGIDFVERAGRTAGQPIQLLRRRMHGNADQSESAAAPGS